MLLLPCKQQCCCCFNYISLRTVLGSCCLFLDVVYGFDYFLKRVLEMFVEVLPSYIFQPYVTSVLPSTSHLCFVCSFNESTTPILKWEQEVFHAPMHQSRIEGWRIGLFAAADIPKSGTHANCHHSTVHGLVSQCFFSMVPSALIAFCWGRFHGTGGGPVEDVFNPFMKGFLRE